MAQGLQRVYLSLNVHGEDVLTLQVHVFEGHELAGGLAPGPVHLRSKESDPPHRRGVYCNRTVRIHLHIQPSRLAYLRESAVSYLVFHIIGI